MINKPEQSASQPRKTSRFRRGSVLVGISELGLIAGSVAVFFVFLTFLLRFYFPMGSNITAEGGGQAESRASTEAGVRLATTIDSSTVTQFFAGELLNVQRRVQRRSANSLTWTNANVGDTFAPNDAVQTFARSTALLTVNEENRLTIGQNSLVVFDDRQGDPFVQAQGSVLVVIEGELSGTITSEDDSPFRFGVSLPNGDVTLVRQNPDDDVEFLITVNDDQSTTVNLHSGIARIVGRDGMRTTLAENESVTIDSTGTQMSFAALPMAPRNRGPENQRMVRYRNVPEPVNFEWNPVADADRYHITIARDIEFTDRVVDDDVIGTSFRHAALNPGKYYWQVRSRVAWSQSKASEIRQLTVVQDAAPPRLQLESTQAVITAGQWTLQGTTDVGATVYIDGERVAHQNGRINHPVNLQPGANVIVVRAMDDVGNLNYASLSINAK